MEANTATTACVQSNTNPRKKQCHMTERLVEQQAVYHAGTCIELIRSCGKCVLTGTLFVGTFWPFWLEIAPMRAESYLKLPKGPSSVAQPCSPAVQSKVIILNRTDYRRSVGASKLITMCWLCILEQCWSRISIAPVWT